MWFNKIKHPLLFQGNEHIKNYFEGWYFKQVSSNEKNVISFIPGISLFGNELHSFIQYIFVRSDEANNKTIKSGYVRYPIKAFSCENSPFALQVENNVFTEAMVSINIVDSNIKIQGTLKLDSFTPLKNSILMPNIMGYFAYIPKMECYHGIVSMNHTVHGVLKINDEEIDFNNGKGYIEKDWGTSFPEKYIWIQSNNFSNKTISVICSIANIPFMKKSFLGYICNIVIDGTEYRFATYNQSKLNIENIENGRIVIFLENNRASLKLEAKIKASGELIAPQLGKMEKVIKEGLSGDVKVYLYNKESRIAYEEVGTMAGIEIVGF